MTIKDLFRIILKVLAIVIFLISIMPVIPNMFFYIKNDLPTLFFLIGIVLIYLGIAYALIFKSDTVINLLKLDEGFDRESLSFKTPNQVNIINLAILIVGFYCVATSLPMVLLEGFWFFKYKISSNSSYVFEFGQEYQFYLSLMNLFIGLIIIGLKNQISKIFADKKEGLR